jgi:hypothetical protein
MNPGRNLISLTEKTVLDGAQSPNQDASRKEIRQLDNNIRTTAGEAGQIPNRLTALSWRTFAGYVGCIVESNKRFVK